MTTQTAEPGSLLIVDDEEMNRDMLSQRLELKGYQVTAADDGRQALALIERPGLRRRPAGRHDAGPERPGSPPHPPPAVTRPPSCRSSW